MHTTFFNAYELLGVKPLATDAEIKKAYKQKAQEFHPDKFDNSAPANALFKMIVRAKEILLNPISRLQHDYAHGFKVKPQPKVEPEIIYVRNTEKQTDWGSIIGAGLLGLAVGATIVNSRKRRVKRKK